MKKPNIKHQKTKIYLGIDGGQSHTEAIVAGENGEILGQGFGGPSNHAEIPGGRERLEKAIVSSVGEALIAANLPPISETIFSAAHCGMTGGAIYKEEIIGGLIRAEHLVVGHDGPTALFGATAGQPGIVVIAGTGSVVFGIDRKDVTARAGGLGYLFSDEGSGFWLATQMIRLAVKEQDGLLPESGILQMVLDFFGRAEIRELTDDFYNAKVFRDEIAALAKRAHETAAEGHQEIFEQIKYGADVLAESVGAVAVKLDLPGNFPVAGVGGMFRSALMSDYFRQTLGERVAGAEFIVPRFGPAIGALLMAYRRAGVEITEELLTNLE